MNLGENIYKLRTEKNMSQGDLADALEVSRQSVSKWENNSAVPELEKLMKMAQLFGVSIDELVNGQAREQEARAEETPERIVYVEKQVPTGITGVKLLGAILLICAGLLALLMSNYGYRYDFTEVLLIALPVALCGVICLLAKHPLLWCSWIGAAGYWLYIFILSYHWEEETLLLILGIVLVAAALIYTVRLHKRGAIHVPAWVWALLTLALTCAGLLLMVNLLPSAQGDIQYAEPPMPVESLIP